MKVTVFSILLLLLIPGEFNKIYSAHKSSASSLPATQADAVDPYIFALFIDLHDSILQEINKRNQKSPTSGQALLEGARSRFGLNANDFAHVGVILRDVSSQLRSLHEEAVAYRDRCEADKKPQDSKIAGQFTSRQRQILISGMDKIENTISPSGWQNLKTYLNGRLKSKVRIVRPEQKK